MKQIGLALGLMLLWATGAQAVQATGFLPGAERVVTDVINSLQGVWIPASFFLGFLVLIANLIFNWFRVGIKIVGLVAGLGVLGFYQTFVAAASQGTVSGTVTLPLLF